MFVLEKLLRNFSEVEGTKTRLTPSIYDEMINEIEEWRNQPIISEEYHERMRLILLPYLKESIKNLQSLVDVKNSLQVFLFAHDHKIELTRHEIDWTALMKRLIERGSEARKIIVRLLRYLRVKSKEREIEEIGLLMTNTLSKLVMDSDTVNVSFALQCLTLFPHSFFEENQTFESILYKLLRSRKANDRLKTVAIKLLREKYGIEKVEIRDYENSALLSSELNVDGVKPPVSSSKVINLRNGRFDRFSEVERSILNGRVPDSYSNGYEQLLFVLSSDSKITCITGITDMNLLRYLLRMDRITVDEFITSAQLMNITDYELICEKSSDPEITSDYLKKIPMLSCTMRAKNLTVLGGNEDIMDLSLPAQWHIFKGDKNSLNDLAKSLYEKYKNNCDGSGEIFQQLM